MLKHCNVLALVCIALHCIALQHGSGGGTLKHCNAITLWCIALGCINTVWREIKAQSVSRAELPLDLEHARTHHHHRHHQHCYRHSFRHHCYRHHHCRHHHSNHHHHHHCPPPPHHLHHHHRQHGSKLQLSHNMVSWETGNTVDPRIQLLYRHRHHDQAGFNEYNDAWLSR